MKLILTISLSALICLVSKVNAQSENESPNAFPTLQQKIDSENSIEKETQNKSITKEHSFTAADPNNRSNPGVTTNYSPSTKATRTSAQVEMTEIKYTLNNSNGVLSNLLNLNEIKEKANNSANSTLLNSVEYKQLLKDISKLRTEFDSYVASKGIENCSTLEQSHYLAFLKEEGKEEAYQNAMAKLK